MTTAHSQPNTRRMLLDAGIELESEGGDVQAVEISALKVHF